MNCNQNSDKSNDHAGSSNSNSRATCWPEEISLQTGFYYNNDHILNSSSSKYHLTYRTKRNKKSGRDKEYLVLYHSETNDVVDVINTNDIIGAELEINFDNAETITANSGDSKGSTNISTRNVGIHNDKAKERAEEMAKYEKELGKRLLIKGNMDMNMDLEIDNVDRDGDGDGANTNNDAYSAESENDRDKNTSMSESAAYLNIYCYPRSIPRPGLIAMLKNKCSFNNHDKKKNSMQSSKVNFYDKLTKDDNSDDDDCDIIYDDEDDVDETKLGQRYENHRRYKLFPTEDFSNAQQLIVAIRKAAKLGQFQFCEKNDNTDDDSSSTIDRTSAVRKQNYLVIVNPFSGTKKGKMVYETLLSKMLQECGVDHDVLFTERPGHALDRMKKVSASNGNDSNCNDNNVSGVLDVSEYDAIVAVGGDGILSEILNGLQDRDDYSAITQQLKVGIVGCGTCNGLAASVLHEANEEYGILQSIFLICKGQTSNLDVSTYQTKNETHLGFLAMTWAMISNIDIDSECIRFLGILRNDLWGAWLILTLKSYKAKFSYLPAHSSSDESERRKIPNIDQDIPSNWVTIEDEFVLFWASHVSHAASNVMQSPASTLSDGLIRIWVVRKPVTRFDMAGMLVEMGGGKHISYKSAEFFDCKAFRLTPLSCGSYNVLDGEIIQQGCVQGTVCHNKVKLFSASR